MGESGLKKLFFILALSILLAPSLGFSAGSGTIVDPWDTVASFNSGYASASCGDTVYMDSGGSNYTSSMTFNKVCTTGNEITISCSDGASEDLGGCQWTLGTFNNTGSYNIIRGMHLNGSGGVTILGGDGNKYEECKFENLSNSNAIFISKYSVDRGTEYSDAQDNVFENCTFEYSSGSPGGSYFYMGNRDRYYSTPYLHDETNNTGNSIKKCVFRDISDTGSGNYDVIQTGAGSYAMLQIESGDTDPSGLEITGNTSGCTMTIGNEINVSGSWGGGDWAGYIFAGPGGSSEGTQFQNGETLSIGGDSDCATVVGTTRGGYAERTSTSNFLMEYTLFDNIDLDNETISVKCGAAIFRYNYFKNVNGALTLRLSDDSEVYGNFWYVDDDNTAENQLFVRGLRVYESDARL
jgi:hypothetical protein